MSVDAAALRNRIAQYAIAPQRKTRSDLPAGGPDIADVRAPLPVSAPAAPRNWEWLSEALNELRAVCQTVNLTCAHGGNRFIDLQSRLDEVCAKLRNPPAVELQSLQYPPPENLSADEHARATQLVAKTAQLVTDVSTAAAESGLNRRDSILRLCVKILLGVLTTVGAAALGMSVGGPLGPVLAAMMGCVAALGTIVLPIQLHERHNSFVDALQGVDDILNALENIMNGMPPEPDSDLAPQSSSGEPSFVVTQTPPLDRT
jgi:hypothetical protein